MGRFPTAGAAVSVSTRKALSHHNLSTVFAELCHADSFYTVH